ncbi:MAG TPA: hypothetical protein VEC56_07800 [Candidatus Krumholzibacteria bacterium]|nr:hypothetical protein [Candidatus Krumholzibacteria bacterium]
MRKFMPIVVVAVAAAACSSVKEVATQDMPLEVQHQILDEYKDRYVWTRVQVQDLGEGGVIPRDEKVKIVDVGMFKAGSVTVETLKKKNRVVQGLSLDKPLTKAKIDSALTEYFWFDDPTLRHVAFIRKFGKDTAKLIMNHDLVAGMSPEAALASWGKPAKTERSERNGVVQERWRYPTAQVGRTKDILFENGKVRSWDQ